MDDAEGSGPVDRSRNVWGRPEQARRRDRTGRPLGHDEPTPADGGATDHEVATVEQALTLAVTLWDEQRYFEAHELLEHVWHHAPDHDRAFWQGVIQVAVTHVMGQRQRPAGVVATVAKARQRLLTAPPDHHGIDVPALRAQLVAAELAATSAGEAPQPGFPALPDGPWFDRDVTSTPLTREPPWLVASRERADARSDGRGERS